jgi:peptidoglycan/LPS O-acetylase OafA/YrhL
MIGELSYPFYVIHWFCLAAATHMQTSADSGAWIALALTMAFAALTLALEVRFIEPWRARFSGKPAML